MGNDSAVIQASSLSPRAGILPAKRSSTALLRHLATAPSDQQQRGVFQQAAKFFDVLCAERAIDAAMIAAHPDLEAIADDD